MVSQKLYDLYGFRKLVLILLGALAVIASVYKTWELNHFPSLSPTNKLSLGYARNDQETIHKFQKDTTATYDVWGVITTIFEVNTAVKNFASCSRCALVVVGDLKTDPNIWYRFAGVRSNVFYLSPDKQKQLGFHSIEHIPWNHFGRKSIGFLYAIGHGAEHIWDFDDDNHLKSSIDLLSIFSDMRIKQVASKHHVYNPYPEFRPIVANKSEKSESVIWPRGFPLQFIRDTKTWNVSFESYGRQGNNVAVFQSLAQYDPDLDAIYRLTRPLPIEFKKDKEIVVVPAGTFTPWNAQAVLISRPAFFGMLLPITVPGRVSDIWRSYITTRILWETQYDIAFTPAIVTQYRNPHSYMVDLVDEKKLYYENDLLLETLLDWESSKFETLDKAWLDIIFKLTKKGLMGNNDFQLASAWVQDLSSLGYLWPPITQRQPRRVPRSAPIIDERSMGNTEKENIGSTIDHSAMFQKENATGKKKVNSIVLVLSHSHRSKGGVTGLERRNGVRETWKNAVPDDCVFRFVMDHTKDETILEEAKTFSDIMFLKDTVESGQAKQFGKKFLEMSKWALKNYDFRYFFRVDDDNFLCIEHILSDLKSLRYPESIVWGWWSTRDLALNPPIETNSMESANVGKVCKKFSGKYNADHNLRPDEMLFIVSSNLIEEMFGGSKQPVTYDLMDVTLVKLLRNLKITYMVDNARIIRGSYTYGPDKGPSNPNSFCQKHIAYHKCHPGMMQKLWNSAKYKFDPVKIHENCIKNKPLSAPIVDEGSMGNTEKDNIRHSINSFSSPKREDLSCRILKSANDASYEPVCKCTYNDDPKRCLDSGTRTVPLKCSDIRSKFEVELCNSRSQDPNSGLFLGLVNIRRRKECGCPPSPPYSLDSAAALLGPDQFDFTLEGKEVIDVGANLTYVLDAKVTSKSTTCPMLYTAKIRWKESGSYIVRFLHLRENYAAVSEKMPPIWPMMNYDLPLGTNMVLKLGDSSKNPAKLKACSVQSFLASTGRFVWDGIERNYTPRTFGVPYMGPKANGCYKPLLRINPIHYKWQPYDCYWNRRYSRRAAAKCIEGKRLFLHGDSHMRRLFNILLYYACGSDDALLKKWGSSQNINGRKDMCHGLDITMTHTSTADSAFNRQYKNEKQYVIINTGQHPASGSFHWTFQKYRNHIKRLVDLSVKLIESHNQMRLIWIDTPAPDFFKTRFIKGYKDWRTVPRTRAFNSIANDAFASKGIPVISYFSSTSAFRNKNPDGVHFTIEAVMPVIQHLLVQVCGLPQQDHRVDEVKPFYPVDISDKAFWKGLT